MPKFLLSHYPAWGWLDLGFGGEPVFGRHVQENLRLVSACRKVEKTLRLAQGLSLVVKNFCPGVESIAGTLHCCLRACFHCGRNRMRDLQVC